MCKILRGRQGEFEENFRNVCRKYLSDTEEVERKSLRNEYFFSDVLGEEEREFNKKRSERLIEGEGRGESS